MPKIPGFTPKQIATLFGVSILTVRDWISDPNGLRAIKVGNNLYISGDEAKRYYEKKYGHTPPTAKDKP